MTRLLPSSLPLCLFALPLAAPLFLTGCGSLKQTAAPTTTPLITQHGTVHGGQQPVSGASVQLYAAGTNGDGSVATPLLSSPPLTDASGSFNITGAYTCPSSTALVYIVATGGNPGLAPGVTNASLSLMAALGTCGTLTPATTIVINELTTVAAVSALAPFMTSASAIGSGTTDAAALTAAFTLASQLANSSTGSVPGTNIPAGATVPVSQINTIADILAACVNSAGGVAGDNSTCGKLFSLTTPTTTPATTPASDTITALLHLALNPVLNTDALFSLITAAAPFQPLPPLPPPDYAVHLILPSTLAISPTALTFASLPVSFTSTPQTVTLTNTGSTFIAFSSFNIIGSNPGDFHTPTATCTSVLAAHSSCTFEVTFTPTAAGTRNAYLSIVDSATNSPHSISFSGTATAATAGPVKLSPSTLTFTQFGTPQSLTLSNQGSSPLTIQNITIADTSGTGAYFSQSNNCGTVLAPQSSCSIAVSATTAGAGKGGITGTLTVVDDAAAGHSSATLNSNIGLTVSGPVDFGAWAVGTTSSIAYESLINPASTAATYTATITGPNASDFSFVPTFNQCIVSAPKYTCAFQLLFHPSALGARSATLQIAGYGSIPITGSGNPAGPSFSFSPSPFAFSPQALNTTQTLPNLLTITNNGTTTIQLSALTLSGPNASEFSVTTQCTAALAPAQSCLATPAFTPTQIGTRSATLTLTDSTSGVHESEPLTGIGFNPTPGPTLNTSLLLFPDTSVGTTSAALSVTASAPNGDPVTALLHPSGIFQITQGASCTQTPCQISLTFSPTAIGTFTNSQLVVIDQVTGLTTYLVPVGNGVP